MSPVPTVLLPWSGLLQHDAESFDPSKMKTAALGFGNSQTLERFAWDLELLSQLEALAPAGAVTFAGGGCTMLHLDKHEQRVSVDLDLYFWTGTKASSEAAWKKVMDAFAARLGHQDASYFQLIEYVPSDPKVTLPMHAYEVVCPTATGQTVMATGLLGCRIVVEVVLAEPASREPISARAVLPFASSGPHTGSSARGLIASKLLALSVGEVGLPHKRMYELAKHVHDIARLQQRHLLTVADLEELHGLLKKVLAIENSWHRRQSTLERCQVSANTMMNVFESTLLRAAITDLENNNLRTKLGDEIWQTWPRLVRLLFSAAVGPHQRTEFLEARRVLDEYLWIAKLTSPQQRKQLEDLLLDDLNKASYGSRGILKGLPPSALFIELVFHGRLDAAIATCRPAFDPAWPPFPITPV